MANILFKVVRICNSQFKCSYFKNEKIFLNILFHFWILHQILNTLKEKIIVIANVFPKLQTVKSFARKLSQEHRFRTGFESQYVKDSQLLPQIPWERFYHVFLSFSVKLIRKMSPLVLEKILTVFVNTLTPNGKYPVEDFENLHFPIQMHLSEKPKSFSEFSFHFWILHQILNILKENMIVIANVFPKL